MTSAANMWAWAPVFASVVPAAFEHATHCGLGCHLGLSAAFAPRAVCAPGAGAGPVAVQKFVCS